MEYNPNQGSYTAPTPVEEEYKRRSNTVMVLGIVGVSIFFLPIINIAGFVLSIIALVKAKDCKKFAAENGLKESGAVTAGYVCGIVGVIIGGLSVLFLILAIVAFGFFMVAAVSAAPAIGDAIEQALPLLPTAAAAITTVL